VKYLSLGTFEFLANPRMKEFYFLEINPRLQVEHTITETILDIDLVRSQLLIAQGATLASAELPRIPPNPLSTPSQYACQLRITAEDVSRNWTLSVGKISSVAFPGGNGIRLDQAITPGQVVGSSFDSLLAKIIVSGRTWQEVVRKAQRALHETVIEGVKTNLPALRGIVAHPDFSMGDCDTTWLETHQNELIRVGSHPAKFAKLPTANSNNAQQKAIAAISAGPPLFRRGDAWTVELAPTDGPENESKTSHLSIARILRNDFPSSFVSEVEFTTSNGETMEYKMTLNSTTSSATAVTSDHRRGDVNNPRHITIPFPGKLVEVMVDEGDVVRAEDVICVVQQMKMEIEIRAKRPGRVVWVTEIEDGEEVTEGILAAEIEPLDERGSAKL
jgi:pyruvate carboxylase